MRKNKAVITAALLSLSMILGQCTGAVAQNNWDATIDMVEGSVVFPGDTITGVDNVYDANLNIIGSGMYTIPDEGKTYYVSSYDDGTGATGLMLTEVGKVLTVVNGTSRLQDVTRPDDYHYSDKEPDMSPVDPMADTTDIGSYEDGALITVTAGVKDGMVFDHWEVVRGNFTLPDPTASEFDMNMPSEAVELRAVFAEPQPETQPEQVNPQGEDSPMNNFDDGNTGFEEFPQDGGDTGYVEVPQDGGDTGYVEVQQDGGSDFVEIPGNDGYEGYEDSPQNNGDESYEDAPQDNGGTVDFVINNEDSAYVPEENNQNDNTYTDDSGYQDNNGYSEEDFPEPAPEDNAVTPEAPQEANPDVVIDGEDEEQLYTVTLTNAQFSDGSTEKQFAAFDDVEIAAVVGDGEFFQQWLPDDMTVIFDDINAEETSFLMPSYDVSVEAVVLKQEVQTEAAFVNPQGEDSPVNGEPEVQTEAQLPDDSDDDDISADPDDSLVDASWEGDTEEEVTEVSPDAPETDAPQSDEPTTDAPETDAPETDAPEENETETETGAETDAPEEPATEEPAIRTQAVYINDQLDQEYEVGFEVFIVAPPAPNGQVFSGWTASGVTLDDPTSELLQFIMPDNKVYLTANYKPLETESEKPQLVTSMITLNRNDITVKGASYTNGAYYGTEGKTIVVTARTPGAGYKFDGFKITTDTGSAVSFRTGGTGNLTASFVMPKAGVYVQANYSKVATYSVVVDHGNGDGNYTAGSTVRIVADAPAAGYVFDGWTIVSGSVTFANSSASTTTFVMPDHNVRVSAFYKKVNFTLTVNNGSGDGTYASGTKVNLTASMPSAGKEFAYWTVKSKNATVASEKSFYTSIVMPAADVTVEAVYKDGPQTSDNYIDGINAGGEYLKGASITFTAVGAGMGNTNPNPGDYRYRPNGYSIGTVNGGWSNGKYTTSMAINATGEYTLKVTYNKEVFNGSSWVADGSTDTKQVRFYVVNALSVNTGDSNPILPLAAAGVAALLVILGIVIFKIKGRK